MKNVNILFLLTFVFVLPSSAGVAELDSLINEIKTNLYEVKSRKSSYEQEISYSGSGVLQYMVQETNNRGRVTKKTYEFNLADIDPYAVREKTKRDLIMVSLTISDRQKLIKAAEDGKRSNYANEVVILAKDIDNARVLAELIKTAIPLAKEVNESRLEVATYEDMIAWLTENITEVKSGGKTYQQKMEKGEYEGSITFSKTKTGGNAYKREWFAFNLADINPNSLQFEISRDKLGVNFKSQRRQRVIRYKKNNKKKPFQKGLTILAENVENARDIRAVLKLAITASEEVLRNAMPEFNGSSKAINSAVEHVGKVAYGDNTIEQSFDPTCITQVTQVDRDKKGYDKYEYAFNVMDLDQDKMECRTSRKKMYLEVSTKKGDELIKEYKNSEFEGYTNSFKLYVEDIEKARRLQHALIGSIEFCTQNYQKPYPDDVKEITWWIMENVRDLTINGTTFRQDLGPVVDGNFDKVIFSKTEMNSKGGSEKVYEFNLSDINHRSVKYKVKGNELSVGFETNFRDKIIKYYKDGKIKNYVNGLEILFDDVETARNFRDGMIAVTKGYEK